MTYHSYYPSGTLSKGPTMNEASEQITPEEWKRRCAARYMDKAGINERVAIQLGKEAYEQQKDEPEDVRFGPEEAADEDMACWEDDRDE